MLKHHNPFLSLSTPPSPSSSALPNGPTAAAGGGPIAAPSGGGLVTVTQQVQDVSGGSTAGPTATAAVLVQQGEGGTTSLALM